MGQARPVAGSKIGRDSTASYCRGCVATEERKAINAFIFPRMEVETLESHRNGPAGGRGVVPTRACLFPCVAKAKISRDKVDSKKKL